MLSSILQTLSLGSDAGPILPQVIASGRLTLPCKAPEQQKRLLSNRMCWFLPGQRW